MTNNASINENDAEAGFKYKDAVVTIKNGNIYLTKDEKVISKALVENFMRKPRTIMRKIQEEYTQWTQQAKQE